MNVSRYFASKGLQQQQKKTGIVSSLVLFRLEKWVAAKWLLEGVAINNYLHIFWPRNLYISENKIGLSRLLNK